VILNASATCDAAARWVLAGIECLAWSMALVFQGEVVRDLDSIWYGNRQAG
jgi:hypothetical protein